MVSKEKYESFKIYGTDESTDAGIFVEAYDWKMNICYYVWEENGTPFGNQDFEMLIHIDKENTKKIANKFRAQTNGQLVGRFGEIFIRHKSKAFEAIQEWLEAKGIAYSKSSH